MWRSGSVLDCKVKGRIGLSPGGATLKISIRKSLLGAGKFEVMEEYHSREFWVVYDNTGLMMQISSSPGSFFDKCTTSVREIRSE